MTLTLTIKQSEVRRGNIHVEMDLYKFEKMASLFGFFNPEFLKSIERAEEEYKQGKVKKIASLKDLE